MLGRARRVEAVDAVTEPAERPTLRSVSPRWVELHDKLRELGDRKTQVAAELTPLVEEVRKRGLDAAERWGFINPPRPPEPEEPPGHIVRLLGHLAPAKRKRPEEQRQVGADIKLRQDALSKELSEIEDAGKLLREELQEESVAASRELCTRLLPEYRELASEIADATRRIGDLWLRHHAYIENLRIQGAVFGMLRIAFEVEEQPLWQWLIRLEWLAEAGHITAGRDTVCVARVAQSQGGPY
jgi:hypothetical protein